MTDNYVISSEELAALRRDASVSTAIGELANILSGRSQDLPHRFKTPQAFGEYLANYGVNQSYRHQLPMYGQNSHYVMTVEFTMRPTQGILEMIFMGSDGTRLFTLELEYGPTGVPKL